MKRVRIREKNGWITWNVCDRRKKQMDAKHGREETFTRRIRHIDVSVITVVAYYGGLGPEVDLLIMRFVATARAHVWNVVICVNRYSLDVPPLVTRVKESICGVWRVIFAFPNRSADVPPLGVCACR